MPAHTLLVAEGSVFVVHARDIVPWFRGLFRIRVRDAIPFLVGDAAVLVLAGVAATLRAVTA
jgi:hypothetical protein